MKNEREDTANADMAGAGYDSGISQNGERVQGSDSEDDNGQTCERDSPQDTQLSADRQEDGFAELVEDAPRDLVGSITQSVEWRAPLPPPSVFNQYPDKAQDAIIKEFERTSERNGKTLEAYRALDKEESERRNKILNQENKKINAALWMTFIINISLLIIMFVAVILNQTNVAIAAGTVLGSVAVSKAFSQRNSIK